MSLLGNICSETSHMFILVMTIFSFLFFLSIYLITSKYKSLRMILFANGIKLTVVILYYIKPLANFTYNIATHNFLSTLQISYIILAILIIYRLKVKLWPFVFFNVINLAQGIYFTLSGANQAIIHSTTSYIIALMAIFCIVIIVETKASEKKVNNIITIMMLALFSSFHILRGTLFIIIRLNIGNIQAGSEIIKFMSILSYGLFMFMNFMIVYLNYSYLMNKVRKLSYTDKLTGALNRGFFIKLLEVKLTDLKRKEKNLLIAILDLDDFKKVNDTYGHLVGDDVLKAFTAHLRECVRENDIICRYGGEEFLVLMEVASKREAKQALKRMHDSVRGLKITEQDISITFSGGMEFLSEKDAARNINEIIKVIDDRLYEAKKAGKDCIV